VPAAAAEAIKRKQLKADVESYLASLRAADAAKELRSSRTQQTGLPDTNAALKKLNRIRAKQKQQREQQGHDDDNDENQEQPTARQKKKARRLAKLLKERERFQRKMGPAAAFNVVKNNSSSNPFVPRNNRTWTKQYRTKTGNYGDFPGDDHDDDGEGGGKGGYRVDQDDFRCRRPLKDFLNECKEFNGLTESACNEIEENHHGDNLVSFMKNLNNGVILNTYYDAVGKYVENLDDGLKFALFVRIKMELNWFRKHVFKSTMD